MRKKAKISKRPPTRFGRREEEREPRQLVLVVCEGECTEPYYFDSLRRSYGLSNVRIAGRECGSSPQSVVDYALEMQKKGLGYDRIFCVIDRDEHERFDAAVQRVRDMEQNGLPIEAIISYPAFEFWYVLHFEYTRSPIIRSGARSPGENAIRHLKTHIPHYSKKDEDMFQSLKERLGGALANARRSCEDAVADGEPNPSTDIHKLIYYLQNLANSQT